MENEIIFNIGQAISKNSPNLVATSIKDFLMSFFPNTSNKEEVIKTENLFSKEFGLEDELSEHKKRYRQLVFGELLENWNRNHNREYLFSFFGGGTGYRIFFDCVNKTMQYEMTPQLPEIKERYMSIYGGFPITL